MSNFINVKITSNHLDVIPCTLTIQASVGELMAIKDALEFHQKSERYDRRVYEFIQGIDKALAGLRSNLSVYRSDIKASDNGSQPKAEE